MESLGFVPLVLPFKPTHSDPGTGAAGENQIPGSFFPLLGIKKREREKEKSLATSPASSLPNSGEEAGLARERRRRGGETTFCLFLPNPFGSGQRAVKISHYVGQAPPPRKKPRGVTGSGGGSGAGTAAPSVRLFE